MGTTKRRNTLRADDRHGVRQVEHVAERPIIITTLATHGYLPWLQEMGTLELLATHRGDAAALLGCVGCQACEVPAGIGCYLVPAGMLDRSLGNPGNGCIQHGNWVPYLPASEDAVIICVDGDVKMQRPFSADEWAWLQAWRDGEIGIGPNEPKAGGDSMGNELHRIQPILSHEDTLARFGQQSNAPIGNAGCVVATRSTWIRLWMAYLRRWLDTAPLFAHIAVQQWTLNLVINEGFNRVVLPPSFHTHGHWGYPGPPFDGWGLRETATYEGETILFAHKTW